MAVTSTTIPWNAPFPGAGGSNLRPPESELSCHDRTQGRLYQILDSDPEGDSQYIVTLDMDTCVELSRVEIDGGDYHNLYLPCAIEGTDWIVSVGNSPDTIGFGATFATNTVTGAVTYLENQTIGGGNEYLNNTVYYIFSTPLGSGRSLGWGVLVDDNDTYGRIPNAGMAVVTIDHSTGALAFVAFGDQGPPRTSFATDSILTEALLITFVKGDATATTATAYFLKRKPYNGLEELADRWSRRYLYSITITTSLIWSYQEIGSFNDDSPPDAAPGYAVLNELGGYYKFSKSRLAISTHTTEIVAGTIANIWLLSTVDCSIVQKISVATSGSLSRRISAPGRYGSGNHYMFANFHPTDGVFATAELSQEVLLLNDLTLDETVWLSSADLAANGNIDWPAAFIDASRCAIYEHGYGDNYEFVRLTFPCDAGGGGDEGEPSEATIIESIGQFTGLIRVIVEQPCPILGTMNNPCLTGRASWPPGVGQILCGRDDVALPCD